MRIGIVCTWSWDIPGGVQAHIRDLATELLARGHEVQVLAPGDTDDPSGPPAEPWVTLTGKAVGIPYNGSVARMQFGPRSAARVRRWLREGRFDIVHVHEPAPTSLSLLTLMIYDGPMVATFHAATTKSRILTILAPPLRPFMEKLDGRIAVSAAARKVIVEHLNMDAVVIPNGVSVPFFAGAEPLPGYPRAGGTVGFIGRWDEPRKGMPILLDALCRVLPAHPDVELLVAGVGEAEEFTAGLPDQLAGHVRVLGRVSDADKARMLRSVDVYVAPNTGQESFGVILLEAMAAHTPVVASDIEAFRRVLENGQAGLVFDVGDGEALAAAMGRVLDDPALRARMSAVGDITVAPYDWSVVTTQILRVYELALMSAASRGAG